MLLEIWSEVLPTITKSGAQELPREAHSYTSVKQVCFGGLFLYEGTNTLNHTKNIHTISLFIWMCYTAPHFV